MIYLAYIVFIFALMQFANATVNLIFIQKLKRTISEFSDLVSILIPARNEEKNIGALLKSMQVLNYKHVEILVYDDQSTDRTADIVKNMSAIDNRVRLIESKKLESGWLGKNYACHFMAKEAKGKYLLFIDADVILSDTIIEDALNTIKRQKLGLLSVFPKQIMITPSEKITVPLMNYILLTLLPLIFVRVSPFRSHAAANGQFMFFSASAYKKFNPHLVYKKSPVEDIAISRYLKKNKVIISCMLGDNRLMCRMYHSYSEALNGFSKNVLMFFGNQSFPAILFWFFTTLGFIAVLYVSYELFLYYIGLILLTRILVSIISKQNIVSNILLLIPQHFFLLHVIIKAIGIKFTKNYVWKGRRIYSLF